MQTPEIIGLIYLGLSSTVGAYFLAKRRVEPDRVTLFDVFGHVFPAIVISPIVLFIEITTRIKL